MTLVSLFAGSSKKAAIYDGCNQGSRRLLNRTDSILKEGSHLRRLQLAVIVWLVLTAWSSKKAAIYDGCNLIAWPAGLPVAFLKEGSHLRRLQQASAGEVGVNRGSSKKAAIYDGCNSPRKS